MAKASPILPSTPAAEALRLVLYDRHALLFEPSSSPSSSASKDFPPEERAKFSPENHLFPDTPTPRLLAGPVAPQPPLGGHEGTPSREAPRPQRHITLFAAVELPSPHRSASCNPKALSSSPSNFVPSSRDPPLPPPSLAVRPDAAPGAARATAAAACVQPGGGSPNLVQRSIDAAGAGAAGLLLPPRQPAAPACPSTLVDKTDALANSLKCAAGGGSQRPGLEDLETRRFVAQELQEINRLIQERALRLKRQEEEASAYVAAARESLRVHAQHLLNQAAEKLERVAAQQRRRTELAYEEAAAVLRRASEARRLLREERNQSMQLHEQRQKEQQLRLMATAETLEAERRLRLDLQSRLHALQQENTQLRELLHAHCPSRCRKGGAGVTSGQPLAPGVSRGHTQPQPACRQAAARQSTRLPLASATSTGRAACMGAAAAKNSRLLVHAARPSIQGTCLTEATQRGTVLDLQLRLPPLESAAPAAAAAAGLQQQNAAAPSSSRDATARLQQQLQQQQQGAAPPPSQPPEVTALDSHPRRLSASIDRQPEGRRRRGSSSKGCEASDSSLTNDSSLKADLKRRSWRKKTRRRPLPSSSRLSRSASRGSLSTSTSSSCGRRQLGGLRRSSKEPSGHARSHRISFSVPESHTRRTDTSSESFTDARSPLKPPSRAPGASHRLLLRADVAGRLQASLARLQEKQLLQQEQVRSLAQRALLQPSS
ncbi:hypothetical protein Emag_005055 [Eimeria magna]